MPKQVSWLIGVAIVVLGMGGVLFYAQPKDQDHSQMPAQPSGNSLNISLEPANYDFGTISMKDGLVTKSFQVKNTLDKDFDLSTVYTSCMCTNAKFVLDGEEYGPFGMQGHGAMKMLNKVLKAGQEAQLLVTFDPNAHGPSGIGVIERSVSIQSADGDVASVNIKANVTP